MTSQAKTPQSIVTGIYEAWSEKPFVWGKADCLHFAAACAKGLTRRDPAKKLKRRYKTRLGARRVMRREKWGNMGDVAATLLPEIPVAQALTGDWAHVKDAHGNDGLGVVCNHMIAVRTEAGMGQVPLGQALRVFRVE